MFSKRLTTYDIQMRWEERGEGLPVVFVHGIPTGPPLWREVIPRISGARCLAWEMPGYGLSIPEGRSRDIGVAAQAEYLIKFLDAQEIEKAVLAGHDLGGGVVQIAAVRHPERVAGLFLTNSIAYDSWPVFAVRALRATRLLSRHTPKGLVKTLFGMFMDMTHTTHIVAAESTQIHWTPYSENDGIATLIRQARQLHTRDTLDISPGLPRLKLPVRIAWGAQDRFQPLKYGERLAQDLNAPLRRIEDASHYTPEDNPEAVAEEISRLIEEVK